MPEAIPVLLVNRCFTWDKSLGTSQSLRRHLATSHNYTFPKRINKIRQVSDKRFWFLKEGVQDDSVKMHYGCPCCVAHFDQLVTLHDHFCIDHHDYVPSSQGPNKGTPASANGKPRNGSAILDTISNDTTIDHDSDPTYGDVSTIAFSTNLTQPKCRSMKFGLLHPMEDLAVLLS